MENFSEGLAVVSNGTKSGYIDKTGKVVIEPKYSYASRFSNGLAGVETGHDITHWGFIDKTGKVVIKLDYQGGSHTFSDGLAVMWKDGKWVIINEKGKVVFMQA